MEKIFTPNRWFVLFCALLILVWGALRIVADIRLCESAKAFGQIIFTWNWPDLALQSEVESINAQVLRRGAHDAVVTVTGRQVISKLPLPDEQSKVDQTTIEQSATKTDLKAELTFYRLQDRWELGKVELK